MGYLNGKSVYLCGAMNLEEDDGIGWRDFVIPKLEEYGITIYDPTRKDTEGISEVGEDKMRFKRLMEEEKFHKAKKVFEPVSRWDLRRVDKADFLIVAYDPTVPTVGTIDEIVTACGQRKPVLLKYGKEKLRYMSIWMTVRVDPDHFFSTWERMFEHLNDVDSGNANPSYWTL